MTRKWKPGDVAMVECGDGKEREATYCTDIRRGDFWRFRDGQLRDSDISEARPLVVIDLSEKPSPDDPASRTEAHHLIDMLRETADNFFVPVAAALARKVADQIEAQVGVRKPKPEEPTGLGAVVEDATGNFWIRHGGGPAAWMLAGASPSNRDTYQYDGLNAVKVLAEGVQP